MTVSRKYSQEVRDRAIQIAKERLAAEGRPPAPISPEALAWAASLPPLPDDVKARIVAALTPVAVQQEQEMQALLDEALEVARQEVTSRPLRERLSRFAKGAP